MSATTTPVRRIVTGIGADGRSRIVDDGPAPSFRAFDGLPGLTNANLWVTGQAPAPVDAPDASAAFATLHPPEGGTVVRVMDIPPERRDSAGRPLAPPSGAPSPFPDFHRAQGDTSRHPRMHTTDTVDYAVCLAGEIWAVMDEGETLMRAGDVLIQRGTNHAWSNRSDAPARMLFVLIDAARG